MCSPVVDRMPSAIPICAQWMASSNQKDFHMMPLLRCDGGKLHGACSAPGLFESFGNNKQQFCHGFLLVDVHDPVGHHE